MAAAESERRSMSNPRQYELVYIVAPEVSEDGVAELHVQVNEIITGEGGQIESTDNWGKRRLAYKIEHHNEGTYVVELINGPAELVRELDRRLKVMDKVLRHLVVRVDEDLRKAANARTKRQNRQQRRRSARGVVSGGASSAVDLQQKSTVASETEEQE